MLLVTVASWEDRFILGLERNLASGKVSRVRMLYFLEYASQSESNRAKAREYCERWGVELHVGELLGDAPATNWARLRQWMEADGGVSTSALVDISTMPRETIWTTLWNLEYMGRETHYIYHRPKEYGKWFSRDPQRPRLIYKMSGVSRLSARTALVVVAGFDVERTKQLIDFYEPGVALLGKQTPRHRAIESAQDGHSTKFENDSTVKFFEVDAFSNDHGQEAIRSAAAPYQSSHNVIMSSLGPKLSAIALYRIHRSNPEWGLAYAPSKEFNSEYSMGIDSSLEGVV